MTRNQSGVTLIELVISIVIITTAVGAILGVLSLNARNSADAIVRVQAVAIAQAYLEEIQLKSYAPQTGSGSRANYDDVDDYNGLNDSTGARDQLGNVIAGLENYRVQVAVTSTTLNAVAAKRIDVSVTDALGYVTRLSGFRTSY